MLKYKDHIDNMIKIFMFRPTEVDTLLADYSKAKKDLNWEPKV